MFVSKYSSCFRTLVVSLKVSTGSLQGLSYRCVLWLCCFTRRASQRVLAWTHFQLPYCRYCCFYVISLFLWRFQDNKNKSWRGNQSVILVWRVSRAFFQNGVTEWLSVITGQLCTVALLRFQTALPRPPPSCQCIRGSGSRTFMSTMLVQFWGIPLPAILSEVRELRFSIQDRTNICWL